MKTETRLRDPDDLEVSITLTMTVGELKKLREQLGEARGSLHHPSTGVMLLLRQISEFANKTWVKENNPFTYEGGPGEAGS